jgi:mRNA-degrading endonuclease YafQ of YafQ-DinJ toxin-antitoxin module
MPVELSKRFDRKFDDLPLAIQRKVSRAVFLLNNDFRHPGLRSHPVKGYPGIFEAYVDDKYRMTFERQGNTLIMRNVDNHDECLKNP